MGDPWGSLLSVRRLRRFRLLTYTIGVQKGPTGHFLVCDLHHILTDVAKVQVRRLFTPHSGLANLCRWIHIYTLAPLL